MHDSRINLVDVNHRGGMDLVMDLARRLRERGVSQAELARAVGVSPQAVSFWVTGQKQPSEEAEARIREFLGGRPPATQARLQDPGGMLLRAQSFVDQCALMLTGAGMQVRPGDRESDSPLGYRSDLIATSRSGRRYLVECRLGPSTPKNHSRMREAVAQLLFVEATHAEDGTEFLLLTDRPLPPSVHVGVERLRDVRPRLHVVVLEERDATDRLRAFAD
jgi:DNA-binding XRE family transcriptional regulator